MTKKPILNIHPHPNPRMLKLKISIHGYAKSDIWHIPKISFALQMKDFDKTVWLLL